MKAFKRITCLLLVLASLLAVIPTFAAATEDKTIKTAEIKINIVSGSKTLDTLALEVANEPVRLDAKKYITYNKTIYEFSHYLFNKEKLARLEIPAYDGTAAWMKKWNNTITLVYVVHTHKYKPCYTRLQHWDICGCGKTTEKQNHVNPATDSDKICTCGYKFSSNADLVTLWMDNMVISPRFHKDITEYTAEVITYKDVTDTTFCTETFDGLAKVKLPESTALKEGVNKFQFVVTAEDASTTKTYTVIAVKPIQVENNWISFDGTTISTELKPKMPWPAAVSAVSEGVGEKIATLAAAETCTTVHLRHKYNKWGSLHTELTLPASLLNALAEKTKADLIIETPYGSSLTIPNADLAVLAKANAAVTVTITREDTFRFTAGEDASELTGLSEKTILTIPENSVI